MVDGPPPIHIKMHRLLLARRVAAAEANEWFKANDAPAIADAPSK
jgi:hypothetical protein